ncbi:MAG: hypothetical protein F6K09_01120 [Merismopedia sp. SIO2A8]|nr:hypothetical protein [Symploca sp. SIO2B6]NET47329.1 hypothetical protein [Merismopedia sp. SIO2A8]
MTFYISSALASQTASRTAAVEILQQLGKRPASVNPAQFFKHHQHTKIEHWWCGVKVSIAPFWETGETIIEATYHKGISTIISWKKFAKRLWDKACSKAVELKTRRISSNQIKVEGSQAPGGWWTVTTLPQSLECNCHLYRCEHNRLIRRGEAQPLLNAIYSNSAQIREVFNESSGQVESSVQIVCHHIKAAMWNEFDASNVEDYLLNYREITDHWQQQHKNNWSDLSFEVPPPPPLPELPEGSYLERTDDWTMMEFLLWCYAKKTRISLGDIPWTTKCIGRIVEQKSGFSAYRPHSGMSQVFSSKYDAVAYLIRNAGYSLQEVADAYRLKLTQ